MQTNTCFFACNNKVQQDCRRQMTKQCTEKSFLSSEVVVCLQGCLTTHSCRLNWACKWYYIKCLHTLIMCQTAQHKSKINELLGLVAIILYCEELRNNFAICFFLYTANIMRLVSIKHLNQPLKVCTYIFTTSLCMLKQHSNILVLTVPQGECQ